MVAPSYEVVGWTGGLLFRMVLPELVRNLCKEAYVPLALLAALALVGSAEAGLHGGHSHSAWQGDVAVRACMEDGACKSVPTWFGETVGGTCGRVPSSEGTGDSDFVFDSLCVSSARPGISSAGSTAEWAPAASEATPLQHSAPFSGGCVYYGFQFVFFFIGHDGVFVYVDAIFHLGVWAMGRMGY